MRLTTPHQSGVGKNRLFQFGKRPLRTQDGLVGIPSLCGNTQIHEDLEMIRVLLFYEDGFSRRESFWSSDLIKATIFEKYTLIR